MSLRSLSFAALALLTFGCGAPRIGPASQTAQSPTAASPSPASPAPCVLTSTGAIPARWWSAIAFDEARGNAVIFGGTSDFGTYQSGSKFAETLTWTSGPSGKLVRLNPANSPSARQTPGMVYDADHKYVLLFGGISNAGYEADTWIWDGSTWTPRHPANSPLARAEANLVYDPDHHRVLLFGGIAISGGYVNDTWEWDGFNWTQLHPAHPPQLAANSQAMAYSVATHQVVLLGMATDGTAQTYAFDGTDWIGPSASGPWSSFGSMSTYRGGVAFFGYPESIWLWNGAWNPQPATGCQLQPRRLAASTYDPATNEFLIFGGLTYDASQGFGDLWSWNDALGWRQIA